MRGQPSCRTWSDTLKWQPFYWSCEENGRNPSKVNHDPDTLEWQIGNLLRDYLRGSKGRVGSMNGIQKSGLLRQKKLVLN